MRAHIRLGSIAGIPIGLHFSWFLIAALITLALGGWFSTAHPDWTAATIWASAVIAGVLFFGTLVLHELSHALVARASGVPVASITLFALGGVAHIRENAGSPGVEFRMGIVGPLTSALIGGLCLTAAWLGGWAGGLTAATPVVSVLVWLGFINVALAVFNMLPGYPLDGGRVARAALWWLTGDVDRATRLAARGGQVVGGLLMAVGLSQFIAGAGLGGLWPAVIGWFLLTAAQSSYQETVMMAGLRSARVRDVMTDEYGTVDAAMTVAAFVDNELLRTGRRCYIVTDGGSVAGLVTTRDIKHVARERWPLTQVRDAMRPLARVRAVGPDASLADTLTLMNRHDVNQLPVLSNSRVDGMVSRAQLLRLVQAQAELGRAEPSAVGRRSERTPT